MFYYIYSRTSPNQFEPVFIGFYWFRSGFFGFWKLIGPVQSRSCKKMCKNRTGPDLKALITNSPKWVPNTSLFSKSTTPRMPSQHVEHHQTMTTAQLNGAWDDNNTQPPHWLRGMVMMTNEALVCIFFVFLNSFYFTNVSLHVQPSLPPLTPPYYPMSQQQQTRRVQHHTKWRRRVGPLPACTLMLETQMPSRASGTSFFGIFHVFFFCTNN